MGKAIKDKEELKNVEVPENAEAEEIKEEEPKEEPKEEPAEEPAEEIKEEAEWLVETPNPSYTGLNVTIEFKNGKGTTKNKVIAEHFEAKGYKVTKL